MNCEVCEHDEVVTFNNTRKHRFLMPEHRSICAACLERLYPGFAWRAVDVNDVIPTGRYTKEEILAKFVRQ